MLIFDDKYFAIALLITNDNKSISRCFKNFCIYNNLEEIKSSKLTFDQKQFLFNKLKKYNYKISYIVIDKQKAQDERIFIEKNLFYSFISSLIIEKVAFNVNEDINIVFDSRSIKVGSENSLSDYIKINAYTKWNIQKDINISFVDSKNSKMIQVVDLIANAIYAKYNYNKNHFYNQILEIENIINYPIIL